MFDNPSDEVLRRLGRNLLIFQQVEAMLKYLLGAHRLERTLSDLAERQQSQVAKLERTTLGNLVASYKDDILRDAGEEVLDEDPLPNHPWFFRFCYSVTMEPERLDRLYAELKCLTEERNQLVHNFLPRWEPKNAEAMAATLAYLDEQRTRIMPTWEYLKSAVDDFEKISNLMRSTAQSNEFHNHLETIWLQGSRLVAFFTDVTQEIARKDGWTYLAWAGKLASEKIPEELANLKERYGYDTLKKTLQASQCFDVFDEPLPNGKFRTLYKPAAAP